MEDTQWLQKLKVPTAIGFQRPAWGEVGVVATPHLNLAGFSDSARPNPTSRLPLSCGEYNAFRGNRLDESCKQNIVVIPARFSITSNFSNLADEMANRAETLDENIFTIADLKREGSAKMIKAHRGKLD